MEMQGQGSFWRGAERNPNDPPCERKARKLFLFYFSATISINPIAACSLWDVYNGFQANSSWSSSCWQCLPYCVVKSIVFERDHREKFALPGPAEDWCFPLHLWQHLKIIELISCDVYYYCKKCGRPCKNATTTLLRSRKAFSTLVWSWQKEKIFDPIFH